MASNRKELVEKISWLLATILVVSVTCTFLIDMYFHPLIEESIKKGNIPYAIIFLVFCALMLLLISEKMIGKILKLVLSRKLELNGWWTYCFLFPATEYDKKNMVCFSIAKIDKEGKEVKEVKEEKVLVIGSLNILHNSFELSIKQEKATSKTFNKNDKKLCYRVPLKIKNLDFKNDDIIIIYKTTDGTYVPIYKGIMDLDAHDMVLIRERFNNPAQPLKYNFLKKNNNTDDIINYTEENCLSYTGLIQDIELSNIVKSRIYVQHLKYEKTQKDVENVLEKNADNIIQHFIETCNATLI